jgi:hypothetical protein
LDAADLDDFAPAPLEAEELELDALEAIIKILPGGILKENSRDLDEA